MIHTTNTAPRRATWGVSRRRFALAAGAAFGAVAGRDRSALARFQGTPPASSQARTVEHTFGATEIVGVPRRVVTVGYSDQDAVLALGVVPVAVRIWLEGRAIWPWNEAALSGAQPEILPAEAINFEQIAALSPDLILALYAGLTEEEYATLAAIAPTVAQPADFVAYGVPWQEQTRLAGRALGREGRAAEVVAAVEDRFAAAREQHPAFAGATGVAAYSFGPGEYGIYGPQDPRRRFLAALGFELPAALAELAGAEFFTAISRERLDLLETDLLIWIVALDGDAAAIAADPLYQRLTVAKEGRDVVLTADDPLQAALSFSTALSIPFALDGLLPRLAAALDGDPLTTAATSVAAAEGSRP